MSNEFRGIPAAGLQFLADLGENNNKEWFTENKDVFQVQLLEPAVAFVTAVGERLQSISNQIQYDTRTNGSGSLMRIYRDTRFSKDKTPYKTAVAGMWWQGAGKKTENPAFGFQITKDGMGLMAGMFGFSKEQLAAYREAVVDEKLGKELGEVITAVTANGQYEILGQHYKKVPRGFAAEHERAEYLKFNHLYAHPKTAVSAAVVTSPELVDVCMAHCEQMAPIQQWLVKVLN